jgi:hypothetical protein
MGLMDRVKAQATQLAQQAQEAAQEGRAKLDQAQAGRRGDTLLRQLGAAVFAERTGRGTPDSQAKIDKLIADMSTFERESGTNLIDQGQQMPSQPAFPPDPPSPFPGQPASSYPAQGATPFADTAGTSFAGTGGGPAQGAAATSFPAQPAFFPAPGDSGESGEAPSGSGSVSGFPPEA